jgi:hypothetical protein
MMLKAAEARKKAKDAIAKLQRDHDIEYAATKAKEARQAEALWKKRGPALVSQIEGYIKKASAKGYHGTWAPSDLNPNGDEIIWVKDADLPIHELLMDYFRNEGYDVEEYQNGGMKITW